MGGNFKPEQVAGLVRNHWQVWAGIRTHSSGTSIIMPAHDNWFPMDTTSELALTNSITVQTITEGKYPYFTGAWKYVWRNILNMMSI